MALSAHQFTERIAQDPAVLVGKPVIRGTRISVGLILDQLSGNLDLNELYAAYPNLRDDDVKAALAFARKAVRARYLRSPQRKAALAEAHERNPPAPPEGGHDRP